MLAIQPQEYARRRQALRARLEEQPIYLTAHRQMQRLGDAAYPFAQEANFRYLTGVTAADWRLLIMAGETLLVRPELSEVQKIFEGFLTDEAALAISGADGVVSQAEATERLEKQATGESTIWTLLPHTDTTITPNPAAAQLVQEIGAAGLTPQDCRAPLARLRALKTAAEIACIEQAVATTIAAFETVRQQLSHYRYEYEIEAAMTQVIRGRGASGHAYDPIVASGKNACTLHYGANHAALSPTDLILIDVGAEVEGYAADITRTYGVEPTDRQQALHQAVQAAQKDIIGLLGPGVDVREYSQRADQRMQRALEEVGLMKPADDAALLRRYYPHATSHGLGLEVHDSLGAPSELLPGMVLTVEPGLYVESENTGIRIEDDILITENGARVLSRDLSTDWA